MRLINIAGLYYVGYSIHPLTELSNTTTYKELMPKLYAAQGGLKFFENMDKVLNLSFSRSAYTRLKESVSAALENYRANPDGAISFEDHFALTRQATHFESVSAAEFESLDTYAVAQSMAYNTRSLIERGEDVVHESLRTYLPDMSRKDLREATRCLAYGLNTAVGFHILRAVEATILELLALLGIPKPTKPVERNLGNYITLLAGAGVDARITLPLDQIRSLHRNELMHPDRNLNDEESSSLFEVSKAALTALLMEIKAKKEAAAAATAALTPSAPAAASGTP